MRAICMPILIYAGRMAEANTVKQLNLFIYFFLKTPTLEIQTVSTALIISAQWSIAIQMAPE